MKNKLTSIYLSILLIICSPAIAQSNEVCGFVKHYFDKTPVEQVNLYIENTIVTTTTDEAGAFCLNLTNSENKIFVEKEGYFKTYIIAKTGSFLNIEMIKNTEQDLAVGKGLSLKNIEVLNLQKETNKRFDRDKAISSYSKVSPTMSFSSKLEKRGVSTIADDAPALRAEGAPAPSDKMRSGATYFTDGYRVSHKSVKLGSPGKIPSVMPVAGAHVELDLGTSSKKETSEKKRSFEVEEEDIDESKPQKEIKAGRLTAGEIHDFSKWELWNDLSENELSKYKDAWSVYPKERYVIQAVTEQGFPVVDAVVELKIEDNIVWKARTDNTGKAELWNVLFKSKPSNKKQSSAAKASISYKGIENNLPQLKRFEDGVNVITFKQDCNYAKNVDIAFVVDATGSMGDEIDYLKVELLDVIDKVQNQFDDLTIRLGNVFYRDKTDAYLTKNSPLTQNIKAGVAFIKDQQAGGGGDFPEAVDVGLEEAVNQLQWSNKAVARILFLVLDAPPHQNEEVNKRLQQTITKASQKGLRIVPIVGSGIDKSTEYLLRSCALATNGHYVFLTDHSGIGGAHLKPSTDSYEVKNLNDLLVNIVMRYVKVPNCDGNEEPGSPEPSPNTKISILPNPNDGRFLIKTQTDLNELFITDANGKILVRFTDFATGENQVDIANFPTGTYYVRYQKEGNTFVEKVIIKR